ncbi:hypothetical protein [Aeromonas hydrophila]|uniref:hypothetical protein n=1 Tax=Aeromonas hydrophila TaxID=644 RepID=UPI002B48842F|nr:hypothetical protein [Aeromonas hydrophila]
MNHPFQPIVKREGVIRFKENKIVCHLLDHGGITMNDLSILDFSVEDREQFAQLIGYSLNGFGELSYVRSDTYETAAKIAELGQSETEARIAHLEGELLALRQALREPIARLYGKHPDDLLEQNES